MSNKKSWYDGKLSEKDIVRVPSNSEDCIVDYDKNNGMYRVSIFDGNHFLDEFWFEEYKVIHVPETKSLLKTLESSKLKPYSQEEKEETDMKLESLLSKIRKN